MISLINLLSKLVGVKREVWRDPKEELPKRGRPLVWKRKCELMNNYVYIGGFFDGKYFRWQDYRFHPSSITEWAYKSVAEKAGVFKADKTK